MGKVRGTRGPRVLVLLVAVLTLAMAATAGCAPGSATRDVGSVRVHTTATRADETVTVFVRTTAGHLLRQARGPGAAWDATFTDVPAGRYLVQLQIDEPSTSGGSGGVVISSSIVTQAPAPVVVERGSSTYLVYDGTSWTAVQ